MNMMKHIQTWLLITLLALSANGAVSAKLASGYQNLSGNLHQSQTVLNALLHQGLEQVSTMETSGSPLASKGPKVGGGADLKNLSPGQQKRIQNAADKSGADITVVGSQTTGKRPGSDFDFILEGGTSRSRSRIKNSLPQGPRGTGDGGGRDFLDGPVDKSRPFIKFTPKPKG